MSNARNEDTGSSPHLADIGALAASSITGERNPPANTTFCPDGYVARAQMAAFLIRGLPVPCVGGCTLNKDFSGRAAADPRRSGQTRLTQHWQGLCSGFSDRGQPRTSRPG